MKPVHETVMIRSTSSGSDTRALQAVFRRFAAELDRVLDVFLVGLRKRARLDGVFDRENRVAFVHLRVVRR